MTLQETSARRSLLLGSITLIFCLLALVFVNSAQAQEPTEAGEPILALANPTGAPHGLVREHFHQSGAIIPRGGTLPFTIDDGTHEQSLWMPFGGQFLWFNRFTPSPSDYPFTLTEIQLYTASESNCAPTDLVDFYVYTDVDNSPWTGAQPVGTLLNQPIGTLNQYNTFNVNIPLGGPGDLLIGVVNRTCTAQGTNPAAMDRDSSQERSWIGVYGTFQQPQPPQNPPVLPADEFGMTTYYGFPVNFMVRGVGESGVSGPTPSPIPTLTPSLTPTPTRTPVPPTNTPTPTITNTPTVTRTPTATSQIPQIHVTPDWIGEAHTVPTTSTQQIAIQNIGSQTLTWTIAESNHASPPRTSEVARNRVDGIVTSRFQELGALNPILPDIYLFQDDGHAEQVYGRTGGGQFLWLHRYTPEPAQFPFTLTEIQVLSLEESGCAITDTLDLYVWTDTDGDPSSGATFVGSVLNQPIGIFGQFSRYATNMTLNGPGDVLIGVVNRTCTTANSAPAAIDTSSSVQRSYVGVYNGAPGNPPLLPAPDFDVIDDLGLPGNWMIRAVGNQGGSACSMPSDIPWLSLSTTSGSTTAGGSTPIMLTYDSRNLADGVYAATLCIASNDANDPLLSLPINFYVGAPTAVEVTSPTVALNQKMPMVWGMVGLLVLVGIVVMCKRK